MAFFISCSKEEGTESSSTKTVATSGSIEGSSISYSIEANVLTLSGTGAIPDYKWNDDKPWESVKDDITKIIVSDGITHIGKNAFYGHDSLYEIELGKDVASMDATSFDSCYEIANYTVSADNAVYSSENGILYDVNKTVVLDCPMKNAQTTLTLPNTITEIGEYAFYMNKNLTEVILPESVRTISKSAFSSSSIKKVVLNEGLETIGDSAFYGTKIDTMEIPSSVKSIGKGAFQNSYLKSFAIPNGSKYFAVSEGVLFTNDMSKLICYPAKLEAITYSIPDGVKTIGYYSFYYADIAELILPSSVIEIEDNAFSSSYISRIELNEGLKKIGEKAFSFCNKLTQVELPSSLIEMGYGAFAYCDNIANLTVNGKDTSLETSSVLGGVFEYVDNKLDNITIYGHSGSPAESYAKKEKIKFVSLSNTPTVAPSLSSSSSSSSSTTSNTSAGTKASSSAKLPSEPSKSSAKVDMKIPKWLENTSWISSNGVEYCKVDGSDIYAYDAYAGWISMKDYVKGFMDELGDLAKLQIQTEKNASYIALVYNKDTGVGIKAIELNNFHDGQFDFYMVGQKVGTFIQLGGNAIEADNSSSAADDFLNSLYGDLFDY